jgi:hypothetical protein
MIYRKEIVVLNGSLAGNGDSLNNTWYSNAAALFDSSKYSGSITCYWEVLAVNTSGTNRAIRLTGNFNSGGGECTVTTGTSSYTLFRSTLTSGEVTFINGKNLGILFEQSSTTAVIVKAARLIVVQDTTGAALTSTQSQFEIGNRETAVTVTTASTLQKLSAPKYWRYDSANFDGTCTFYGEVSYLVSSTTGSKTIVIQEATSAEPSATWSTVATMLSAGTGNTVAERLRSTAFTPVNGRFYRLAWTNSSTMTTVSIFNAKIIVDQTGSDITLTEDHYLLANTTLAAGTALQSFLTKWDSAEWSGVTNSYYHQVDAGDNNTSVVELDGITSGSAVTNSPVSSPDNYKQSTSALTMPSSQNIDVKATTNSGSVFGSRIIVKSVKVVVQSIANKIYSINQSIVRSNYY